jgi:hypothetical protein
MKDTYQHPYKDEWSCVSCYKQHYYANGKTKPKRYPRLTIQERVSIASYLESLINATDDSCPEQDAELQLLSNKVIGVKQ